jgi:hypothetical protein
MGTRKRLCQLRTGHLGKQVREAGDQCIVDV